MQSLSLFAIPTTSGIGAEDTLGAVISDALSHENLIIGDSKIVPRVVKEGARYPVPKLMDQGECEQMIRAMCI